MKFVVAFVRFWYDFVVGDDWQVAVGVLEDEAALIQRMCLIVHIYQQRHPKRFLEFLLGCCNGEALDDPVAGNTLVQHHQGKHQQ